MERSCLIADLGGIKLFFLIFPAPALPGAVSAVALGDFSFGEVDLGLGMKHSGFTPGGAAQEKQLLHGHLGFPLAHLRGCAHARKVATPHVF